MQKKQVEIIPETWSLTPVRGKRPIRRNWQHEESIPRHLINPKGYGLRLGDSSDGLLAIDFDGYSSELIWVALYLIENKVNLKEILDYEKLVNELKAIPIEKIVTDIDLRKQEDRLMGDCPFCGTKNQDFHIGLKTQKFHCFNCECSGNSFDYLVYKYHQDLAQVVLLLSLKYNLFSKYLKVEIRDKLYILMYPKTVEWTSGKPGRKQILFQIPEQYRYLFQDFTRLLINSLGVYECAEKEQLEFRYNGCQSVLPPSIHPETGQYHWINSPADVPVTIAPEWLINFLISQLNPRSNRETKSMNNNSYNKYLADFKLPINKSIPLTICLAPSTRDLLDGVCEGSRNNSGITVAKDLVGTANYLNSIGQSYEGNVYDLLKQYCQQCSPALTNKDCERIYKSAEKSTPKPCLDENKIFGCIASWYWKNSDSQQKHNEVRSQKNVIASGALQSELWKSEEKIEKRIEEIIANCKSDTQRNLQLNKLARISGVSFSELWRIYQIKLKQFNNEDNLKDLTINLLINFHEQDLNLDDVLPQELARVIVKLAEQIPTAPEALLTALLPVWATGIGTKSKIIVNPSSQYVQPAIELLL